jgi:hypothetical protein
VSPAHFWPAAGGARATAARLRGGARARWSRLEDRLPAWARRAIGRWPAAWPWLAGLLIAWAAWPVVTLAPQTGIDPSWVAGLHMATHRGLDFGPQLDFTYGPLGVLVLPALYYASTAAIGLVFVAVLQTALACSLVLAARRTFTPLVAVAAAYVLTVLAIDTSEVLALLVFLWCVMAVEGRVSPRAGRALVFAAGAVGAVGLLVKFNVGVVSTAMAAVAVPLLPPGRWRSLARFAGAFVATFLILWLATRNPMSALPSYARRSVAIASGYSGGFPLEDPTRRWEYPAFAVLVTLLAGLLVLEARRLAPARRLALGLWSCSSRTSSTGSSGTTRTPSSRSPWSRRRRWPWPGPDGGGWPPSRWWPPAWA